MIDNTHGGQRQGAGRPKGTTGAYKYEDEKVKPHQIKTTQKEWDIFKECGGATFLRHLINSGKLKKLANNYAKKRIIKFS